MMCKAMRWNGKEYEEYELPVGASIFETDLNKEISCCKCGRTIKYGESYTSREIHNGVGFGYAECGDCYFKKGK